MKIQVKVFHSKQRLADQTQQITNEYNEALEATKLTVLTGFNGAEAAIPIFHTT
ncbi:MAG: hypothetical protein ACLSA2_00680 [Candidatus Gastranaerophilaceae bacterium]